MADRKLVPGSGDYTHLNTLTSPKVDVYDTIGAFKVLADDLITLLKHDTAKKYMNMDHKRFFREVLGEGRLQSTCETGDDTAVVTFEKFDNQYRIEPLFENLNEKLEAIGVHPRVPYLNNHKIEIRLKH